MKKQQRTLDPAKLSPGVRALNPHLYEQPSATTVKPVEQPQKRGKRRREMNATEREFSLMLQRQMDEGRIINWDYEGLTLRWADGMRYTPDFVVIVSVAPAGATHVCLRLIEVKGAYAWQKDVVKFRAARANWPLFEFEFWQKDANGWAQTR